MPIATSIHPAKFMHTRTFIALISIIKKLIDLNVCGEGKSGVKYPTRSYRRALAFEVRLNSMHRMMQDKEEIYLWKLKINGRSR